MKNFLVKRYFLLQERILACYACLEKIRTTRVLEGFENELHPGIGARELIKHSVWS